jgi:hypothetical protein
MGADSSSPIAAATRSRERVAAFPIGAWLSSWLRSLLVLTALPAGWFFLLGQTPVANGLVQRVRQYLQFPGYFRNASSLLQ